MYSVSGVRSPRSAFVYVLLGCLTISFGACATSDETRNGDEESSRPSVVEADDGTVTAPLIPASPEVQTLQLFRSGDESSLPVIGLTSGERLSLEFDVMGEEGRPLSVYFYHADRNWQYNLQPGEYMEAFSRDDIYSYDASRGTDVAYTHYEYEFPNDDISFTLSGNYVVRVTERGSEEEVLFEKAFFVTENTGKLRVDLQTQFGARGVAVQPVARLFPSRLLEDHPFDIRVCFMRSIELSEIKCVEEPNLIEASFFQFRLPRGQTFSVQPLTHVLDITRLQESNEIAGVDYQSSPYVVNMARDYARFGEDMRNVELYGQSQVSSVVHDVPNPDIDGEYVRVVFRYVPVQEQPIDGSVVVTGSFNDWQFQDKHRMTWESDEGLYRGEALVKQGLHQYQYRSTGEPTYSRRETRAPALYTALAYYYDPSLSTDRLLVVSSVYGR
jgi:hypothetical protein